MKTKQSFWINVSKWFTVSRVLITFWNSIAFCYHFFVIGFDSQTSIIIQITALIIEYMVSGPYERMLLWSNRTINKRTRNTPFGVTLIIKFFAKIVVFTCIFTLVYYSTYYVRLQAFELIDFGVNAQQLTKSMINMVWFSSIAGPIMGFIVIWRKKKRQAQMAYKEHRNHTKIGPSV